MIQIPQLGSERRTDAERLLAIFDQHRRVERDNHILDIDEATYPEKYRKVVRRLNGAVSEPNIKRTMEVEDDILAEFEDIERRMAGMEKALERKEQVIEEKDQALEENAKTIEEKERELAEKDRLIAELRGSR
uniref:Uncharacterized protein n=2 Tax=Candidatus Kentrum sp. TC TaxID=2126339 RepID=A0A451A5F8_9GAMM|nr:MAG: hypothetical protein BECKTC1821F_GA0114240_105615 [Candidatus Kentron sp. TC]